MFSTSNSSNENRPKWHKMSSNWRVPGITILPHVCGIHSCPNIMNSKHPTFTFGTALLPPFTAASPTSVTVTEVTADFSGCSGARNRRRFT